MYCSIKHLAGAKSSLICKALRKYGHSLFSFGVLEYCDKKDIYIREQYYIDTLNPEYNISRVAGSPLGVIRSKETKAKIAAARSGCMHSVETKTKISVGVFGRKHTEQALIKMREAKKDNKHPLFGKTHTEETKTKMSVASPSWLSWKRSFQERRLFPFPPKRGGRGEIRGMHRARCARATLKKVIKIV